MRTYPTCLTLAGSNYTDYRPVPMRGLCCVDRANGNPRPNRVSATCGSRQPRSEYIAKTRSRIGIHQIVVRGLSNLAFPSRFGASHDHQRTSKFVLTDSGKLAERQWKKEMASAFNIDGVAIDFSELELSHGRLENGSPIAEF